MLKFNFSMGISFFNKPSYKRFDLPTRYYDEEKSDFARRMRKWEKQKERAEKSNVFNKEDFKEELKRSWTSQRGSQSTFNQRYTNKRRMIILVLITALLIWIMYYLGSKFIG